METRESQARPFIEGVEPEVDCGRFPIKRIEGDRVTVEATIFADGHDLLQSVLRHRHRSAADWTESPLTPLGNDRFRGEFKVEKLGAYYYTILAWVDRFGTWRAGLSKKVEAGEDVSVELLIGAGLVEEAAARARGEDAGRLGEWARALRSSPRSPDSPAPDPLALARSEELAALVARHAERRQAAAYPRELEVTVDRERARFGAWYEMFPRSASSEPGRHGTFRDCEARLAYVASMGFDILYLPPIHPIGRSFRKGRNGALEAGPLDPGSPWAIGGREGGHKAIHPELGTREDFRRLVESARRQGIELALDLAFQCSPDHPYLKEHPEWFRRRPDGTVQYAENPPKKYQDIVPFDFDIEGWRELWEELRSIVEFWMGEGVSIFRVDNPHTKPFRFWEWLIRGVKAEHPQVIFLSEAFTRPPVMLHLAKLGFSQSYNYFPWRNSKDEVIAYFTELTRSDLKEYFRPNLWPNTPDILTEYLQTGGRPAFIARLALAATLGPSYGIYGPPLELMENRPSGPGREEYLDSEKYQLTTHDLSRPGSLRELIGAVNRIRRENPALQSVDGLKFHAVNNERLICYSKSVADLSNVIVVAVNLDPHHVQSGWVDLPLSELGIDPRQPYQVHDLLNDARYLWHGPRNYLELDPRKVPAHIFRVRRRVRTERDFDYYQ